MNRMRYRIMDSAGCYVGLALTCGGLCLLMSACGSDKPSAALRAKPAAASLVIRHIGAEEGGRELILHSMGLVGTPYRYGGRDRSGFDCSGMVHYVYRQALGVTLPRSAREMAAVSRAIRPQDLRPGDLVFFNTNGHAHSHVGLYIGNGEFVHAPSSRGTIRTEKLSHDYFSRRFSGARTLFAP